MVNITIWHNPRCSKSRVTLGLLQEKGIDPVQVKYLEKPPTVAEITAALIAYSPSSEVATPPISSLEIFFP